MEAELRGSLREGEQLVWADRPRLPRELRRLGLPPRTPARVLVTALVGSGLLALVLAGAASRGPARVALLLVGGLPLTSVGLALALTARRARRTRYGITDGGRALLAAPDGVQTCPLPAEPELIAVDADLEVGTLDLGPFCFEDVAYPRIVCDLVCQHAKLLPSGASRGAVEPVDDGS